MKEEGATSVMRERKERGINNESRGHGEGQTEREEGRKRSEWRMPRGIAAGQGLQTGSGSRAVYV